MQTLNINHFSTTGRNCGMLLRDACVRQAVIAAIATSSLKIFLTQIFPRRGATCYILPWRAMSRLSMVSILAIAQQMFIEDFTLFCEL